MKVVIDHVFEQRGVTQNKRGGFRGWKTITTKYTTTLLVWTLAAPASQGQTGGG